MKKFLTILTFCSLILIQPISWFGWEIWYQMEKEYISNVLCENQDEPEMECHGKCYLTKQLKAAENAPSNNENTIPVPTTSKIECTIESKLVYELIHDVEMSENEMFSHYSNTTLHGYCTPIEHPPC